jgi:hypothetical protein
MPFILNGEVLRDDDPRAVARRKQQQQQSQPQRGQANIQGLGSARSGRSGGGGAVGGQSGGRAGGPGVQQPVGPQHPDGVLAPVARMMGVEGKTVQIPVQITQVIGMEGQQSMPYCHAILLGAFAVYMLFFRGSSGSARQDFTAPP